MILSNCAIWECRFTKEQEEGLPSIIGKIPILGPLLI